MLFRRLAAAALAAALALPVAIHAAHAANLTRMELGRPNTTAFLLAGPLTGGELLKLQAEVAGLAPDHRVVVFLESPGGLITEGLKLGRFFHDARIATYVFAGGMGCHSACSLAFLGGRDAATGRPLRVKMSGARLGFHQFATRFDTTRTYKQKDMNDAVEHAQRVMDAVIGYLHEIGEDLAFLPLMLRAPHESINLVDDDQALMLGIHVLERSSQRLIDPGNIIKRRVASN